MSNILDKSNKDIGPEEQIPDAAKSMHINKRLRCDWSQRTSPGQFMMIDKHLLNIDSRYQRDKVSVAKVKAIARKWDWVLFGVVLVVRRDDSTYWVFDGGHRTRASFYRDEITQLPCMVYTLSDISSEAQAFLGKNLMATAVHSVDKYRASVCAEDDIALRTQAMLKSVGVVVTLSASHSGQLKCINTLQDMVSKNEALAKRCLDFVLQRAEGSPVSSVCLRGLFALSMHFAPAFDLLSQYGPALSRYSQKEMEIRVRQLRAECGKGGERVEALALLSLINKGRRNKLEW